MIITRTPYRISFFGGGTDYPAWFHENGGSVLSTSIDKYVYVTCRYLPPFFSHSVRLVYSRVEEVNDINKLIHPTVREGLRLLNMDSNLEIHYDGDLPARSGMGSSSAFTVGLLHALHGLSGRMVDRMQLAREAIHVEADMAKENVGCQDQAIAAFGGFCRIDFMPDGTIVPRALTVPHATLSALNDHLLLIHTGGQRYATEVAKDVIQNLNKKAANLRRIHQMVDEGIGILGSGVGRIEDFGHLLHEAWMMKRDISSGISNQHIDGIYETARANGAIGGKLLGAGAGGFICLFAPPERHPAILKALSDFVHVSFEFDRDGTSVIYYDSLRSTSFVRNECLETVES